MNLTDPVTQIPGIGLIMAGKLGKLGIKSIFDLLYHLPFRYEDRRLISSARRVQVGESATVVGTLSPVKNVFTKNGKRLQTATITDTSGPLSVIWFNQIYLSRVFNTETPVALFGKVEFFNKKPALISPEYELVIGNESIHLSRLVPIYPETAGVSSKWLRSKIYPLLNEISFEDYLPPESLSTLPAWKHALTHVHFPQNLDEVPSQRHRLAFDELLLLQLAALKRKQQWQSTSLAHPFAIDQEKVLQFISSLPFNLTASQNLAVKQILSDLSHSQPMNRLLEGDVGSGKTIVAAVAAYIAHLNGFQSIILAPTQILATQHHATLTTLFKPLDITVSLVMGGKKKSVDGSIVVGTQALLSDSVKLQDVGLIIIDEQHRFGVAQRAIAASLGKSPHILTMTATPIPRTISLTMFGDLDLSVLSDMPQGRLPVKTWVVPETKRNSSYSWINQQLSRSNSQAFWVCPFIDDSESLTSVKAATSEFANLRDIFPKLKLGLLHGRLKSAEKDAIISKFRSRQLDILVATPVVEVGIDIPTTSIMVIEGAERFGLAQLHQLRGRVGRNNQQAYCLLFTSSVTPRLKAMETHNLGLELAEIDLQLRGVGEIYGTAQHGQPHFKVATYADLDLMEKAQTLAKKLLPELNKWPVLRQLVDQGKIELVQPN